MAERPYNVLFLCTGNSSRSIMGEAILNREGRGRFKAYSAGSHPKGAVNPNALRLLDSLKYDTGGFRSKPWDEFAVPSAPHVWAAVQSPVTPKLFVLKPAMARLSVERERMPIWERPNTPPPVLPQTESDTLSSSRMLPEPTIFTAFPSGVKTSSGTVGRRPTPRLPPPSGTRPSARHRGWSSSPRKTSSARPCSRRPAR